MNKLTTFTGQTRPDFISPLRALRWLGVNTTTAGVAGAGRAAV
ncbi:hypothetical protein [Rheinheimera baltica]|nr:hypothetical protein [Rheinheimera baltica]